MNNINNIYCLSLFLLFFYSSTISAGQCEEPVLSYDFDNLRAWNTTGDVSLIKENDQNLLKINTNTLFKSEASIEINPYHLTGKIMVIRAYGKSTASLKKKKYDTGKIVTLLHTKTGKKRFSTRIDGSFDWRYPIDSSFDWRYLYHVVRVPKETSKITLELKNDASTGSVYYKKVDIFSCKTKDDLAQFDYPVQWKNLSADTSLISASIDLRNPEWKLLNKTLYGFNSYHPYKNLTFRDALNLAEVTTLKPNIIRFPGGALSNYYHWKIDGYRPDELKNYSVYNNKWSMSIINNYSEGKKKRGLADLADWSKRTKTGVVLVLNVFTAESINEPTDFITEAIRRGLKIQHIELGNELYFKTHGEISDANNYIKIVEPIIKNIRRHYPKIKIGIPVFHGALEWNDIISNSNLNFDAVIPHIYAKTSSIATVYGDRSLFKFAKNDMPSIIQNLGEQFAGKEIWVTEWNILDRPMFRRNNSLASVIYAGHALISLLRDDRVTLSAYHSMMSKAFGTFEIQDDTKPKHSLVKKYTFFFWKEIGNIFSSSSHTSTIVVKTAPHDKEEAYLASHLRAQLFDSKNGLYLLIVNDDIKPIEIAFPGFENKQISWKTITSTSNLSAIYLTDRDATPVIEGKNTGIVPIKPLSITFVGPIGNKNAH